MLLSFVLCLTISTVSATDMYSDNSFNVSSFNISDNNYSENNFSLYDEVIANISDNEDSFTRNGSNLVGDDSFTSNNSNLITNEEYNLSNSTENYNSSMLIDSSNTKISTIITVSNIQYNYASNNKITIYLKDAQGNLLVNKIISIVISNFNSYTICTDNKGCAIFNFKVVPKTYTATISFKGDNNYLASKKTVNIIIYKSSTSISMPIVKLYMPYYTYLSIQLKDSKSNAISKKILYLSISGVHKIYKLTTDSRGIAKLKFANKIRIYNVLVKFKGDNCYFSSSKKSKIIINKMPTSIIAPSIKYKSTKYGYFLVTLKDKNGKAIKYKTIYINIPSLKKTYKFITNSSGNVKFRFNGLKTYSVNVKFKGDKYYIGSSCYSKLYMVPVKVKLKDIISMATIINKYVKNNKKIPLKFKVNNNSYSSYEASYLISVAIKNINNKKYGDITLAMVYNPNSFNKWIYKKFYKRTYIKGTNNLIKYVHNNHRAPRYILIDGYKVDYKSYTNDFAKVLIYYNSKKRLPNYHSFSSVDFVKYSSLDKCTFYLTSDNIFSKKSDRNMLKKIARTLNSMGYRTKILGVGPNKHNNAYRYGCIGGNSVLLCCFGGVDVGCIEEWSGELGSSFINHFKGARVLSVWYTKPYGGASSIYKKVGRAWDANYGHPLNTPAKYMDLHGIGYIQKGTINSVCNSLTSSCYGGLKLT